MYQFCVRKAVRTRLRMLIMLNTVMRSVSTKPTPSETHGLASVAPMPRSESR